MDHIAGLRCNIKTKVKLVQSQTLALHSFLDILINKEIDVDPEDLDANTLKVVNSRLDVVLGYLQKTCADLIAGSVVDDIQPHVSGRQATPQLPGLTVAVQPTDSSQRQNNEENKTKFDRIEKQLEHLERCVTIQKNTDFDKIGEYIDAKQFIDGKGFAERIQNIEVHLKHLEKQNCKKCEANSSKLLELGDLVKQVEAKCAHTDTTLPEINMENKISEIQNRIRAVEESSNKHMAHYTGQLEETQSLYRQVCQMVASQVKPLHHLHEILSKYHRTVKLQEEAASQTSLVSAESVVDLPIRIAKLGSKNHVPIGFTAYWGDNIVMSENTTLIFSDVLCNEGNCYNMATGYFTAPYTGLYLTSLTLRQKNDGRVQAQVRLVQSRDFVSKLQRTVCKSLTSAANATCSDTGVVWMEAEDNLFVKVLDVESKPMLSFYSGFSCVMIS